MSAAVALPLVFALAVVVAIAALAEGQNRERGRQGQRSEVAAELETLRTGLETAIDNQFRALSGLGGALAAAPALDPAGFAAVARALARQSPAIRALAAAPAQGAPMAHSLHAGGGEAIDAVLAAGMPGAAGSRVLPFGPEQGLAIWTPVFAAAAGPPWGRAVALVDVEMLFTAAGLRSRADLELAVTAAESGAAAGERALYLGHAAVLNGDPVILDIALPGGDWQLAAVPVGGWSTPAGAVWPIRVLAFLSLGLIAAPMLRTGRLMAERRSQAGALRDREAELATLSRRLALAVDASRVGVWDYDIERDTLVWDARMDELYGMPDDGAPRTYDDWRRTLHPDDLDRAEAEFLGAIRASGRYTSDFRLILPDGAVRHVRAIGAVYREDGTTKIVGVNWDVTRDVRRERELEAKRREAEGASRAKSRFLATVGHEIRSPMNGLTGMLDLLLRGGLDGEQRERAQIARGSAQHLLSILDDLLDLLKIEENRITLAPEPVDAARMAQEVVVLVSAGAEGRDLRLFTSFDGPVPEAIVCDPKRLRQVLLNLLGNAVKFTEAGSVELRLGYAETDGGRLWVSVHDTGVGISDEAKRGLFRRFVQVDSALTRERGGSGLGLAICKELVELMGGEIRVDSVPGLGSTFRFWIPAAPVPAAAAPPARVLVVACDGPDRAAIAGCLSADGHDVEAAPGVAEAMPLVLDAGCDLVILDADARGVDGVVAAARRSGMPVVGLRAEGVTARRRSCADGLTAEVAKPPAPAALRAAVARALAGPPAYASGRPAFPMAPGADLPAPPSA
jgi:signal transduction histidine kinase